MRHVPVLLSEVLDAAASLGADKCALDVTFGLGGHSEALLSSCPTLKLYAIDKDNETRIRATERLSEYAERLFSAQLCFSELSSLEHVFSSSSHLSFNFILADLGISSVQLDSHTRGFSFRYDAPLDMRMNADQELTAATVLNEYEERDLYRVFSAGGLRISVKKLVQEIIRQRPLQSTAHLSDICSKVLVQRQHGKSRSNPATVPFQAIRIEVNAEFSSLVSFLEESISRLAPGGRLAVISFHSTEDLIVTRSMRWWSSVRGKGMHEEDAPLGVLLNKDAVGPTEAEVEANPRSRSARLRVFERNNKTIWREREKLPGTVKRYMRH